MLFIYPYSFPELNLNYVQLAILQKEFYEFGRGKSEIIPENFGVFKASMKIYGQLFEYELIFKLQR